MGLSTESRRIVPTQMDSLPPNVPAHVPVTSRAAKRAAKAVEDLSKQMNNAAAVVRKAARECVAGNRVWLLIRHEEETVQTEGTVMEPYGEGLKVSRRVDAAFSCVLF